MKYYSNIIVSKLREYSRSYGGKEAINYAYGIDTGKQWYFYSENGLHSRTMRKGTKILIDVKGEEMTAEAFESKMAELSALRDEKRKLAEAERERAKVKDAELYAKTVEFIKGRVLPARAAEWVERFKEGNAQSRNRKWGNKAVQIGLDYSDSRTLRDVCKEIAL